MPLGAHITNQSEPDATYNTRCKHQLQTRLVSNTPLRLKMGLSEWFSMLTPPQPTHTEQWSFILRGPDIGLDFHSLQLTIDTRAASTTDADPHLFTSTSRPPPHQCQCALSAPIEVPVPLGVHRLQFITDARMASTLDADSTHLHIHTSTPIHQCPCIFPRRFHHARPVHWYPLMSV